MAQTSMFSQIAGTKSLGGQNNDLRAQVGHHCFNEWYRCTEKSELGTWSNSTLMWDKWRHICFWIKTLKKNFAK